MGRDPPTLGWPRVESLDFACIFDGTVSVSLSLCLLFVYPAARTHGSQNAPGRCAAGSLCAAAPTMGLSAKPPDSTPTAALGLAMERLSGNTRHQWI